jgi:phospholipid transport system substrate-binding protein
LAISIQLKPALLKPSLLKLTQLKSFQLQLIQLVNFFCLFLFLNSTVLSALESKQLSGSKTFSEASSCISTSLKLTNSKTAANQAIAESMLLKQSKQADDDTEIKRASLYFSSVVDCLNQRLQNQQQLFNNDSLLLADFVDHNLLPLWFSEKTLKGLLGKSIWQSLTPANIVSLSDGFNNTLQRYVQESFHKYDGQVIVFESLKLNQNETRGLLSIEVQPNLLPSFNIDFKIIKVEDNWLLYDAMFQGVGFIGLKKDSFRKQVATEGVNSLINSVNLKNTGFQPSKINFTSDKNKG